MPDSKKKSKRDNTPQPETNVAENMIENPSPIVNPVIPSDMSAVDIGEVIHEQTDPPSESVETPPLTDTPPSPENPPESAPFVAEDNSKPGDQFDARFHCVDDNGNPRRNADGSFRKRPLRKGSDPQPVQGEVVDSFNSPPRPSAIQLATIVHTVLESVTKKFIGPEWELSKDEKTVLLDCWSRYIQYKDWDNQCTPDFLVIACTAGIYMPRLMHPNFKEKVLRRRKNALTNNRATANGKNDTGKNHSVPIEEAGEGFRDTGPDIYGMGKR